MLNNIEKDIYALCKMSPIFMKHCKFGPIFSLVIENKNSGFLNDFIT
jgi:hypothetical protein